MFKENGRHKKPDVKETAVKKICIYKCTECESTHECSVVEFGERVLCPHCNSAMNLFKTK